MHFEVAEVGLNFVWCSVQSCMSVKFISTRVMAELVDSFQPVQTSKS